MFWRVFTVLLFLTTPVIAGTLPLLGAGGPPATSASTPFTALHTYFIAASGCNDSNNGTSTSTPWCSTHHNIVCGDVILANSGTYNSNSFNLGFGTVSTCPSTSGGIDGAGGIYFATVLCATASVGDCKIADANNIFSMDVDNDNWAIEGFQITTNTTSTTQQTAFIADGRLVATGAPIVHHVAFINNITTNTGMGFATADGGTNTGVVPGNGVDQWAVVGNIAHDSNSWTQCIGAIDDAGPANFDSSSGTHVFVAGNFAINNQQKYGCTIADGESFFFDTFDAHGYTGKAVMQDNLSFLSERMGYAIFYQHNVTTSPLSTIRIVYNTAYNNNKEANGPSGGTFSKGQINLSNSTTNAWPFPTTIQNNLSQDITATSVQGTDLYALQISVTNPNSNITIGGTGNENLFLGLDTTCASAFCNTPRFDVNGDSNPWNGVPNFYETPNFKNPTDAITNHIGTPNCSGFETTVACMGWNFATQTATSLSVIDDFTAQAAHAAGKGYLPPQSACLTSGERFNNLPSYLKGIVYLHASGWTNGATIVEKAGLINKPCGM